MVADFNIAGFTNLLHKGLSTPKALFYGVFGRGIRLPVPRRLEGHRRKGTPLPKYAVLSLGITIVTGQDWRAILLLRGSR